MSYKTMAIVGLLVCATLSACDDTGSHHEIKPGVLNGETPIICDVFIEMDGDVRDYVGPISCTEGSIP